MAKYKIVDIDKENFELIPRPASQCFNCQECFYWMGKMDGRLNQKQQKKNWFARKRATYGSLGKLLYPETKTKEPIAFIQFAPVQEMSTAKLIYLRERLRIPKKGWCITCLTVKKPWRGKGVATSLVKSVLKDLKKRGVERVDAYPMPKNTNLSQSPVGPVEVWLSLGFKVLNEGSAAPVVRKRL